MACYIETIQPPSRAEYAIWQSIGYYGTYDEYANSKCGVGEKIFICGDLGPHCNRCSAASEFLCDFPVGEGKTCDSPLCASHCTEVAPDLHYCAPHHELWTKFKASGGVRKELENVIAFEREK